MTSYTSMNAAELREELSSLMQLYADYQEMKLSLNMSRGRPAKEQMELAQGMLSCLTPEDMTLENGTDVRNYGVLEGIPEARKLMGDLMGLRSEEVIVCGSSSLNIMYDLVSHAYTHGVCGGSKPWSQAEHPKFLCPVPGYDRHFAITEYFGNRYDSDSYDERWSRYGSDRKLCIYGSLRKGNLVCTQILQSPGNYLFR